MKNHFQVLIIGGGNAGLSLASQLLIKDPKLKLGVIEPSEKHYYQPAWTLVGGGVYDIQDTERNEADYMPENAIWIKEYASSFNPELNQVITGGGYTYSYDCLVVCPGIQLNWDAIANL